MKPRKSHSGFTLIELLVVIAIIGLLLGILVPVLSRARESGRVIVCSSTLRSLFTVHYSYFAEYGELLPDSIQDPEMRPWYTFDYVRTRLGLAPLSQEYKIPSAPQEYKPSYPRKFICPSASYALANGEGGLYPINRSYGVNVHVYYLPVTVRRRLFKETAEHVCLADALDWWFAHGHCDTYLTYGERWIGGSPYPTLGTPAFRHFDRANAIYWDGHCQRVDPNEMKDGLRIWD